MAWEKIDEICASVEYMMESVQKAHVEMPSEVHRHADALADEGRKSAQRCKSEKILCRRKEGKPLVCAKKYGKRASG